MAKGTAELGVDRNVIYLDCAACGGVQATEVYSLNFIG